ncbi:Tyrosine recombinase XerD [Clostridium luticellarii]|jgi:integrase|uniref:Tyrosine recombinase XerD n=1 Tax=Clostridium luticellarii TaxID=1691940 RepID=A0A2T0BSN1_9CLOT|nr:Tyrosine recombinase XerD [Clostridium luticellarii]
MLEKADIDKPLTIHQLRHTFASRALKAGVSISVVSQWLGHADISTTYDTYIHVFKKEKEEALKLLEAM